MRKYRILIPILLLALFFCGCVTYDEEDNNLDTYVFSPYFKPDVMAEDGKKVALSDGRIWYLSAESGEQGLHSMALDGSDVRLEFATEDIRSLTVRDGAIWTAEFVGMDENACGAFRAFRLFVRRDGADGKAIDVLNTVDKEVRNKEIYWEENVWDFYITEKETLFLRFAYPVLPRGYAGLRDVCLQRGGEMKYLRNITYKQKINKLERPFYVSMVGIAEIDDCLIFEVGDSYWYTIFDVESGRAAFGENTRYAIDGAPLQLIDVAGKWLYFTETQEVLAFQPDSLASGIVTAFDGVEWIYASYHTDDTHLLLTREDEEKERFLRATRSDKTLYRLDLETGEREQLLTIETPLDFVYLDENYAATAEGKTLTLYDIRGEEAQEIRKIELSHKIVDKANKTDAAGGWWFLYRFNEETNRDELIEKVRLY